MFFEVAIHLFDPHSASVAAQSHLSIGQIGGQTPGLSFTDFPMDQQMGRVNLLESQITTAQPDTLTRSLDEAGESLPTIVLLDPDTIVASLAQNIEPPVKRGKYCPQNRDRAEFAVAHQENGCPIRDQAAHIGQQC